jgi:hypothetical protein
MTHKNRKIYKCHFLKAEVFSCSSDRTSFMEAGISKFHQKRYIFSCIFLQSLVIKSLDPDSLEILDPEPQHFLPHFFISPQGFSINLHQVVLN